MKQINELDIVDFLTERRELLEGELRKIDSTLAVIKSSGLAIAANNKPTNLTARAKHKTKSANNQEVNSASNPMVPEKFNPADSIDKKILFALSEIEQGNRDDIIEFVKQHEPETDFKKLVANIKVRLSHLLKAGAIDGKRAGRLYTYQLK